MVLPRVMKPLLLSYLPVLLATCPPHHRSISYPSFQTKSKPCRIHEDCFDHRAWQDIFFFCSLLAFITNSTHRLSILLSCIAFNFSKYLMFLLHDKLLGQVTDSYTFVLLSWYLEYPGYSKMTEKTFSYKIRYCWIVTF